VAHQLAHDLRVGLAVEAVPLGAGAAEQLRERTVDRAPAGAVGGENGTVDVEESENRGTRNRGM
jgi:hypothetical protein